MRELVRHLLRLSICGLMLINFGAAATVSAAGEVHHTIGAAPDAPLPPQLVAVPSPRFELDQTIFMYIHENLGPLVGEGVQVWRSVNDGETWTQVYQTEYRYGVGGLLVVGLPASGRDIPTAMVLSPDFHHDQTLFVSQRGILFKSEDAGLSWQQVYAPEDQTCEDYPLFRFDDLNISPDYPAYHVLFWEQSESTIYVSYDDGRSWQMLRRVGRDLYVRRSASARSFTADRRPEQKGFFDDHPATIVGVKTAGTAFRTFLPLANARGPQPLPLTLFITAHNIPLRSDDGGVTWYEMKLPPYRTTFLPMLVASP